MRPTFVTWLWNPRGGWRAGAGYTPAIIKGVQYMLQQALPGCRHVCISDPEYHKELERLDVEPYPLWSTHGKDRTERHGFDCHARIGLWGEPGAALGDYLNATVVQSIDADVLVKPSAGAVLWDARPEVFWMPRSCRNLEMRATFGKNQNTWLGLNGSMFRVPLGSRPGWWDRLSDSGWIDETEAYICGSDQAALTRLVLEQMGEQWHVPNPALYRVPIFSDKVIPWGVAGSWEVAFFPYDPFTPSGRVSDFTKPWLTNNAWLRRTWRVLNGTATEDEVRAEKNPALNRRLRRG